MKFIIDPQRGPHIRDYSDQSQDRVIIYGHTGYWAPSGCGYTTSQMAGVYTRADAYKRAGHCGPEKGCCFYDVPADHVPTLQADVKLLREALELALSMSYDTDEPTEEYPNPCHAWVVNAQTALAATAPKE